MLRFSLEHGPVHTKCLHNHNINTFTYEHAYRWTPIHSQHAYKFANTPRHTPSTCSHIKFHRLFTYLFAHMNIPTNSFTQRTHSNMLMFTHWHFLLLMYIRHTETFIQSHTWASPSQHDHTTQTLIHSITHIYKVSHIYTLMYNDLYTCPVFFFSHIYILMYKHLYVLSHTHTSCHSYTCLQIH